MAKILFDANPILASQKTGVGYYLDGLVSALSQSSAHSYVGWYFDFLRADKHISTPNVKPMPIKLVPGKILSAARRLGFQPPLELFTSTRSADIVFYTNYVALPTLRRRKIALAVYDLSFLDCPEYSQPVNLKYLQRYCPPSITSADLIITISEFTKQRLLYYFPDIRAEIIVTPIPPVADTVRKSDVIPSRLTGLGVQSGKYILYLGTIEPRKNIKLLVEAYALLPQEIRDTYSLVLAGGKGWKDEKIFTTIEAMRRAGCSIIQTGYISDEEKIALYSNARCFTLPSHYEGFGMPILEAMQYGLPVVVSDIPVFHEVAGDAALYFDKDSPDSIAKTLQRVLTDDATRTRLSSASVQQLASFSWQHNAEIVGDAFERLR